MNLGVDSFFVDFHFTSHFTSFVSRTCSMNTIPAYIREELPIQPLTLPPIDTADTTGFPDNHGDKNDLNSCEVSNNDDTIIELDLQNQEDNGVFAEKYIFLELNQKISQQEFRKTNKFVTISIKSLQEVLSNCSQEFKDIAEDFKLVEDPKNHTFGQFYKGTTVLEGIYYCLKCNCFIKSKNRKNNLSNHKKTSKHSANLLCEYELYARHNASISESISHFAPFSLFDDESQREEITPMLSSKFNIEYIEQCRDAMVECIAYEIQSAPAVTIRIDGWSSRWRYEGVSAEYEVGGVRIVRFLELGDCANKSHNALNLTTMLKDVIKKYRIPISKIQVIGSDSAAVNIKIANDMHIPFDPCICHKYNTCFNKFIEQLPDLIKEIADSAKTLKHSEWLREYLYLIKENKGGPKGLQSYSPTRWLTIVNALESYISLYDRIKIWEDCRETHPKTGLAYTINDSIWAGAMIFELKELRNIGMKLESSDIGLGTRTKLLCHARTKIIEMANNEILKFGYLYETPENWSNEWETICNNYLNMFDEMFFNIEKEYCVRNMAAAYIFRTEQLWYFVNDSIMPVVLDFVNNTFSDSQNLYKEMEEMYSDECSDGENNTFGFILDDNCDYITNYFYYFYNQERYPNLFEAACYFIRYGGSNADLERVFSKLKHIGTNYRASMTPDHFKLMSFVTANLDLFKLLSRRILPEIDHIWIDSGILSAMKEKLSKKSLKCAMYDYIAEQYTIASQYNPLIRNLRITISALQVHLQVNVWHKRFSYSMNGMRIKTDEIRVNVFFGTEASGQYKEFMEAIKQIKSIFKVNTIHHISCDTLNFDSLIDEQTCSAATEECEIENYDIEEEDLEEIDLDISISDVGKNSEASVPKASMHIQANFFSRLSNADH